MMRFPSCASLHEVLECPDHGGKHPTAPASKKVALEMAPLQEPRLIFGCKGFGGTLPLWRLTGI